MSIGLPTVPEWTEPVGAGSDVTQPGWTTLTRTQPGGRALREVPSLRRVVAYLCVAMLAVVTVVGLAGAVISRHIAEEQGVHDAAQTTDVLAESVVQPALTDAMASNVVAARALDPVMRSGVLTSSLIRVKLWNRAGRIVYSDEKQLVGRTFPLDDEARASFVGPSTRADISDLGRPENQFERGAGKLLEVYRPVWTPGGEPLLFEAYYKYSVVGARSNELWRGFAGILVSSLAAVFVLLLPVAWTLVARTRRAQAEREAMMRHAIDASAQERRRIAAALHDGVVQQLAASSFAVAGEAERAANAGDTVTAQRLHATAATVRAGMGGLRSLLVELYPASLSRAGLAAALRDLAVTSAGRGPDISMDIDPTVAEQLAPHAQQAVFRVAQEALRNAVDHARADRISLELNQVAAGHSTGVARLLVSDDGVGFDPAGALTDGEPGHFGLALMADAAGSANAALSVRAAPGHGTTYRMDVPQP